MNQIKINMKINKIILLFDLKLIIIQFNLNRKKLIFLNILNYFFFDLIKILKLVIINNFI